MPAFSHLSPDDVDQVTAFLLAPVPGAGGRGAGPRPSTAPPELVVATGSAKARAGASFGRGRGPAPVYPEGVEPYVQYSINGAYGTIGNMMKPPYTTITAYDLNQPAIKWQVGFGDDPSLVADGVTGTGVTQMRNGVVVTAGSLLFGIGGDGRVRAYDSETGQVRWVGKVGGGTPVRGSPAMYELDGRQYLLVSLGSPSGYVAFALPKK
jgi:quinoprotein glucose dehydrogenase